MRIVDGDNPLSVGELGEMAERMFGWSRGEVSGRKFLETFFSSRSHSALAERLGRLTEITLGDGPPPRWEAHAVRRGGQEFPVECAFARIALGSGVGVCAFLRDLTESRRLAGGAGRRSPAGSAPNSLAMMARRSRLERAPASTSTPFEGA